MRTLKEIRQIANTLAEKREDKTNNKEERKKVPAVLVLRRKSVRQFPDGAVALYQADKINKIVSIPFVSAGVSDLTEEKQFATNLEKLTEISTTHNNSISFKDGNSFDVSSNLAKKILSLYENLNVENKQKLQSLLDESVDSFKKVVSFATRH